MLLEPPPPPRAETKASSERNLFTRYQIKKKVHWNLKKTGAGSSLIWRDSSTAHGLAVQTNCCRNDTF